MNRTDKLYGAIYGDIVGRCYEYKFKGDIPEDIDMFPEDACISDDSVMTLASAYAIMNNVTPETAYKLLGNRYEYVKEGETYGYGKNFAKWLKGEECFTNSYGNGCLMRVSPFMWLDHRSEALRSAACTHNCVDSYLAIDKLFSLYYESKPTCGLITQTFNKGFFINAFDTYQIVEKLHYMNWDSMEDAVKYTIRLGGDTDTNASIFAELLNFREEDLMTDEIKAYVEKHLDPFLLSILKDFNEM